MHSPTVLAPLPPPQAHAPLTIWRLCTHHLPPPPTLPPAPPPTRANTHRFAAVYLLARKDSNISDQASRSRMWIYEPKGALICEWFTNTDLLFVCLHRWNLKGPGCGSVWGNKGPGGGDLDLVVEVIAQGWRWGQGEAARCLVGAGCHAVNSTAGRWVAYQP